MKFKVLRPLLLLLLAALLIPVLHSSAEPDPAIAVLTYHRVVTHKVKTELHPTNKWFNDLDVFEEQMKYLSENGYRTLSMEEFDDWFSGKADYDPQKTVLITIDDGNIENYYNVLPVLQKYQIKATVFVIGEYTHDTETWNGTSTRYLSRELIADIQENYTDFEIESHTHGFHHEDKKGKKMVEWVTRAQMEEDCGKMTALGMRYLAYPYGRYTDEMLDVVECSDYRLAFGFGYPDRYRKATRRDNRWAIPRVKIDGNTSTEDMIAYLNTEAYK